MIVINSIRLRNFRGIREAIFSPLTEGITGLSGNNGAGKTTFLDGVLFAMYGVRPDGVTTATLRRNKSAISDECSVSVIMTHQGQQIEVIRELVGKSNKTVMSIFVDGREQTHTSVGVAEAWIENRLGISAQGFMTAYVVRQKELDSLITSGPSERRVLIERFFGIEKTSEALKRAREESSSAKKIAAALPGSEEEVQVAQLRADEAYSALNEESANVDFLGTSLDRAQNHCSLLENELLHMQSQVARRNTLQVIFRESEHERSLLSEKITSLQNLVKASRKRSAGGDEKSYNEILAQRNALENQRREKESIKENFDRILTSLESDKISYERQIAVMESQIKNMTDEKLSLANHPDLLVSEDVLDYGERILDIEKDKSTLLSQQESLRIRSTRLSKSITALREHDKEASCPTCHSHLSDPSELVASLQEEYDLVVTEGKSNSKKIEEYNIVLEELRRDQQNSNRAQQKRQQIAAKIEAITNRLEEMMDEKKVLEQKAEQIVSKIEVHKGSFNKEEFILSLETLNKKLASVNTVLARQEEAREALSEVESYLKDIENIERQIEELQFKASEVEVELINFPEILDEDISNKRNQVKESQTQVAARRDALGIATSRLSGIQARYDALVEALNSLTESLQRKKDALSDSEMKVAVVTLLDEFRKNRISRIAPELSEASTALISASTDGYYTEVIVDEDFTPTLRRSTGEDVPVSWLSGGETSVVSLALRIAIGDMISGGNTGVLWLDEVLVSQDAERRNGMLAMIRSLNRQTVVVSHTPDANDLSDKLVNLVKDDENGSYIQENFS